MTTHRCNIPEIMSYTLISVLKYKYFHKQTEKKSCIILSSLIIYLFKAALNHNQWGFFRSGLDAPTPVELMQELQY